MQDGRVQLLRRLRALLVLAVAGAGRGDAAALEPVPVTWTVDGVRREVPQVP
jgi:hypothetical protein